MNQKELWEHKWKELADAKRDTAPSFIWENIEAQLPSASKNRIPIWWISSLSVVMIGVATYIFATQSAQDRYSNKQHTNSAGITTKDDQILDEQKTIHANVLSTENEKNEKNEQVTLATEDGATKLTNSASTAFSSDIKRNEANTYSQHQISDRSSKTEKGNATTIQAENVWASVNTQHHLIPVQSADQENISQSLFVEEGATILTHENALFRFIPILKPKIIYPFSKLQLPNSPKIVASGDCPDFQPKDHLHFFITTDAGAGFPIKNLTVKVDQNQLLAFRKETETPLISWTANVYAGIKWKRHYSLSTGLQFNQIIEKFSYQRPGLIIITIRPGIDTTVEKRNYLRQAAITYTQLDVPLLFSYDWGSKNWEYNIELGPVFNFNLQTKGLMLVSDNDVRDLASLSDMYKKQVGLGWQAGVSFHRILKNNVSVYFKPVYRSYFNDWSGTTNPLSFSMQNVQGVIGLRKIF